MDEKAKTEEFNPVDGQYFLITKDKELLAKAWDLKSARITADAFDQAEREPEPKALTLEELRERIGKPVWIKDLVFNDVELLRFDKICEPYGYSDLDYRFEQFGIDVGLIRWEGKYGKHWLAYDSEPKEADE